MSNSTSNEAYRRWRLILGQSESQEETAPSPNQDASADGESDQPNQAELSQQDVEMDQLLEDLYGEEGALNDSDPDVTRWLGDVRRYFPESVVHILQQDALDRLDLKKLLTHPELLAEITPDMNLALRLIALSKSLPAESRETARALVQQVVDDLVARLAQKLQNSLIGSLNRTVRTRNPRRKRDVNWLQTIHINLKHYQPKYKTIIPERMVGYGKQSQSLHEIILCVDQSGSMGRSVVHASVCAAVMAAVPALHTSLVLFDTNVVDMTDKISDPLEVLFGAQMRGGTNIDKAIAYCQQLVSRPNDTILVLISDLYDGSRTGNTLTRIRNLRDDGVQVIALLALDDKGTPRYNRKLAHDLGNLGIPAFACTPDEFPTLMAAAINRQDVRGLNLG